MGKEGAEVRKAFDDKGPELDHDEFLAHMAQTIHEEGERKSDAGESAARTAEFNEKTGMNNQAHSWCRSILKKLSKKDGEHKAMDIVRSLETALPMLRNHITGQQTEMPLEQSDNLEDAQGVDAEADVPTGAEATDDETAEFNAEVDENEVDNITPFDPGASDPGEDKATAAE